MFTALALKWYVASNTHNANSKSFNISQHLPISHYFSQLQVQNHLTLFGFTLV